MANTCLNWSQPCFPHSPSSPQTPSSAICSPSSKRRCLSDGIPPRRYVHKLDRSALFGTPSTKLYRSRSCEHLKYRPHTIKRACSANFDEFSDEEFSKRIHELALKFQLSNDDDANKTNNIVEADSEDTGVIFNNLISNPNFVDNQNSFPTLKLDSFEPPDWAGSAEIIPASIERKANSVGLPLSLRIIKRKKQWQEGVKDAGESAYCSVKKAFSSMVFIIRELQSYTLHMREVLFFVDLQEILVRVQREMNASFVWLFQQVFSHTPTLMVYLMILLANYSVHSMSNYTAIAATPPPQATTQSNSEEKKFDTSTIKTFSVSSMGGNNGGGGKFRAVGSGTDGGGGRFDGSLSSDYHQTVFPDGVSSVARTSEEESVSGQETRTEEVSTWASVVEEASRMQDLLKDEDLDHETMQRFVSPVNAKIEGEDSEDYFRTELLYQTGLVQEPSNPLLLANYAQFLFLVAHDYDRAEEYFKRAVAAEPKDAEALSKYASFLWLARHDLWAAEETYLEAISIDPSNSYYAANYAHFLWSTGGEDTCFPLSSLDTTTDTDDV